MISNTNQLEIRQLFMFVELAATLHFGKAAENLAVSQSALSQQIKQIEAILGVSLFTRTNRNVTLSWAGMNLLKEAKSILHQYKNSLENWNLLINGSIGQLKIGFVSSAMHEYLPKKIKKLAETMPKVELQFMQMNNLQQLKALKEETIDIGFGRSNQITDQITIKPVHRESFTLVLPADHDITEKNFQHLGQLANESFILFPNSASELYYRQILNMCEDSGFTPYVPHQAIHGPTIFKLVENKMGISIVPNSLRDDHNYNVRYIELKTIAQKTELFAVWNKKNENPVLKKFLQMI